jgi:tRNA dimethylallyltransferase
MTIPVLCGPTASGKTAAALHLFGSSCAQENVVISADSMQVYRLMNRGTAKATPAEQAILRHEMIDCVDPEEDWSTGEYLRSSVRCITEHIHAGRRVVIVGGTGLYIKALMNGLFEAPSKDAALRKELLAREEDDPGSLYKELTRVDSVTAARLHPQDIRRIVRALEVKKLTGESITRLQHENTHALPWEFRLAGLTLDRAELAERIETRIDAMFAAGLLDEVRMLIERGCHAGMVSMQGLGYEECLAYLGGRISFDEARAGFIARTKTLAQKQMMLFRRLPGLVWFHARDTDGLKKHFAARPGSGALKEEGRTRPGVCGGGVPL